MSTFAYGRIVGRRGTLDPTAMAVADANSGQQENKLITALAAVVPVEVIAAHGIILAAATTTDDTGATTIKEGASGPLGISLFGLLAAALILFVIARGNQAWKRVDFARLVIPALAFLIWTALIGTSALTPWIAKLGDVEHLWLTVIAAIAGVILVAISAKVAPPKET